MKCHDRCSEWTNERNSNKRKGGGVEDEEEVLEWGQAVLLFWNTASLFFFSLIRWGSPPIELREENLLFICVCLFVASRIDSRLLVFRIRLPVTLSVKGEKKKAKASTWRNHTSLKRSSSLVLRRQKRPNFYFLSFSRRIRIDGWASNRLVEKRK